MNNKEQLTREVMRQFRHRIVIQKPIIDSSGLNQEVAYQPHVMMYAEVKNLHGSEYFSAKSVNAENTLKFTIRYVPGIDITTDMIIRFDDNDYNITHIDNIQYQNRLIEIKGVKR